MGMTSTPTTTVEVTPERFVIRHNATRQTLTDAWFDQNAGRWVIQFDTIDAIEFATREAAVSSFKVWRLDPRKVSLARRPAVHEVTAAGREAIAARRAARNADRKV